MTTDTKQIMDALKSIKEELHYIKLHMVDADTILTSEEKKLLDEVRRQTNFTSNVIPYLFEGNKSLLTKIASDMHHTITTTAGGFYAPQGRILRGGLAVSNINEQLTQFEYKDHKIGNFEMETSALYGLGGNVLGHRCLTVCNIIANRDKKTFSKDPYQSINKLIKIVLDRI